MGILDDAIREHLDLKRRLGAAENELARLEDEAFGPPTRPGDPDFPEATAADQVAAEPVTGEQQVSAAPATAEPDEQTAPDQPAAVASEAPADPVDSAPATPEPEAPPTAEHPAPTAESAAVEPPPTAESAAVEPPPGEPTAEEAPASGFYDQSGAEDLELDLDLDLDEVELDSEPAEPPSEEVAATPSEPPIESLDTVEHHFEEAIEDTADVEVVEGELADDEKPAEHGDAEPAEEDEDVLEETPEFLRDQPEDDELWFEQGEPKDFDF